MKEFKFTPEAQKRLVNLILTRLGVFYLAFYFGLVTWLYIQNHASPEIGTILIVVLLLLGAYIGWNFYRGRKRLREFYSTFTLTVTENLISREASNLPTIAIYRKDIKSITRFRNGSIKIKGNDPQSVIIVSRYIDGIDDLIATLSEIMPVVARRNERLWGFYRILMSLSFIGLYISFGLVKNKWIDSVLGLALVALLAWSFFALRKNRNVDVRVKRSVWILFLIAYSVLYVLWRRWSGQVLI